MKANQLYKKERKLARWLDISKIIFSRTCPAQKLIIVERSQKLYHVVAITGNVVIDSPAIKKVDIRISLVISGSNVAIDAADMILLNEDFSNILLPIQEGIGLRTSLIPCTAFVYETVIFCILIGNQKIDALLLTIMEIKIFALLNKIFYSKTQIQDSTGEYQKKSQIQLIKQIYIYLKVVFRWIVGYCQVSQLSSSSYLLEI